jgi:predicted adenine nucleotide alpha hydrolase (AANH) superfamily ATPase
MITQVGLLKSMDMKLIQNRENAAAFVLITIFEKQQWKLISSTSNTLSPHKQSPVIFSVGQQWDEFVAIDFKKKDGYKRSVALAKELGLYRQDYCGCEFSLRDRNKRRLSKQQQTTGHDCHTTDNSVDS